MHFRLNDTVRDFELSSEFEFDTFNVRNIKVTISQPSEADQKRGHKPENAHCIAQCEAKCNDANETVFRDLASGGTLKEGERHAMEYSGPDGNRIRTASFSSLPKGFQTYVTDINRQLSAAVRQIVGLIRWRLGKMEPHQPISTRGLQWSFDNIFWHPMPPDWQVIITVMEKDVQPSEAQLVDIRKLLAEGKDEPVHHQLFREAWMQMGSNPRSAILIGFTALETAVKTAIAQLVPSTEWLVDNLPTPPIEKLVFDYLPIIKTLENKGTIRIPSKAVRDILKNGIQTRNRIAHLGAPAPDHEKLEEMLIAVKDTLCYMDIAVGKPWASELLSKPEKVHFANG